MALSCLSPEEAALGGGQAETSGNHLPGCRRQGLGSLMAKAETFPGEGASPLLPVTLKSPQTHIRWETHEFPLGSLATLTARHSNPLSPATPQVSPRGTVNGSCPSAPSRPHSRLGPPPLAQAGPPRPARRGLPGGLPSVTVPLLRNPAGSAERTGAWLAAAAGCGTEG